ncbi:hypothetical protein MPDQ_004450 [Monascus purpureus]|uniref:CMP/dCMP-type deaminase domain-containing protein n=1 Tax=Monascus purpureus TaxID=5098 RepID=A0A507R1Y3_MONPU|nr:hypothetical protein MPDQ_004450 [Monascus purpureus]BDD62687.1 hypothetical protein MAP00_007648 [Monascus purpureus]
MLWRTNFLSLPRLTDIFIFIQSLSNGRNSLQSTTGIAGSPRQTRPKIRKRASDATPTPHLDGSLPTVISRGAGFNESNRIASTALQDRSSSSKRVMAQLTNRNLYPPRNPITMAQVTKALHTCLALQETARTVHGKRPFFSILLAPDNETVLASCPSISHIRHSETELARMVADQFSEEYLWQCTMVATWEPCAMCAGTLYWANIGRLVYAAPETELRKLTGENNPENVGLDLPCRHVLGKGQKDIEVIGPVTEGGWDKKVVEASDRYWRPRLHGEQHA